MKGRSVTRMTIDDAEHFTQEQREAIIASYPEHERDARIKGIPALGSGRVYPVPDAMVLVEPFPIPPYWAWIGGLDFGWNHPTAAVKLAHDRDADVLYVVSAYKRKEATPVEHCATLKEWNLKPWAWPHDGLQRDKRSGVTLAQDYARHGLEMLPVHAQHADGGFGVEAGIMAILERMQTGRFKVFSHLADWMDEFRFYHRKEGIIVKEMDDLMDATRMAVMMLRCAQERFEEQPDYAGQNQIWSETGISEAAGY